MRVLLLLAFCLGFAAACSEVYTHSRGPQTRNLLADACPFNHDQAGRDWPGQDNACSWTCSGKSQSPINIPLAPGMTKNLKDKFRANLNFGTATNLRVLNLGHAVQVEFDSPKNNKASVVYYGDSIYTLFNSSLSNSRKIRRINVEPLQFHFHSTSEHLLSGRSTMLEFHLVTKLVKTPGVPMPKECPTDDTTCLAVFGVMYDLTTDPRAKKGDANIASILKALPKGCSAAGRDCVNNMGGSLKLGDMFPDKKAYLTYTGSLTTPPCTEGVMWHVFARVKATLTEAQALDLQTALSTATLGGELVKNRVNNRVTQPWNGRNVFVSV